MTIEIKGAYTNENIHTIKENEVEKNVVPHYMIQPHEGFEIAETPNGRLVKLAYGGFYDATIEDLDIEFSKIKHYEDIIKKNKHLKETSLTLENALIKAKFHYKKAISIVSPKHALGWNRWSDAILEMFLSPCIYHVLWGSGNCGKSAIQGLLLYIKWRVNPSKRMIVIASRVQSDATARVFGYIKDIHANSPKCTTHDINIRDSITNKGIYCRVFSQNEKKWVDGEASCIVSKTIKVNASKADIGSNLIGSHPEDSLDLCFDEGQEIPASMSQDKVFLNWLTNEVPTVHIWGNPTPVNYYDFGSHDLLFHLGSRGLSLPTLRKLEQEATKTTMWKFEDTKVLHLTILDSPRDDPEEQFYKIDVGGGVMKSRLHFLGGKQAVKQMTRNASTTSESYYSQVKGFPFINIMGNSDTAVLSNHIVSKVKVYPLDWYTPINDLEWFMGVDPAITGTGDNASIVCGRMGTMTDGRIGIDIMGGKACRRVAVRDNQDFTETIVDNMWELSLEYKIPLKNIAVETIGTGEVFRYVLNRNIEDGRWAKDHEAGQHYHIVEPSRSVSQNYLFMYLGSLMPAKDMCHNAVTELWVATRCAFLSRQLFNVPDFILNQYYNRMMDRTGKGDKYKVETKEQMRKRGIPSPDDADALNHLIDLARIRGFKYQFVNSMKHISKLGQEYRTSLKQKEINNKLNVIQSILGLNQNLRNYNGTV